MSEKRIFVLLFILVLVGAAAVFAGRVELTTYYPAPFGEYRQLQANGSDAENGNLALRASGTDTAKPGLAVTNANNVGIGKVAPEAKLDVEGDVRAKRLGVGDVPPNRDGDILLASQTGNPSNWDAGAQGQVAYSSDKNALFVSNGASWTSASTGGIKTYGVVSTGRKKVTSAAWTDGGLSIKVTPSSANSRFLINANMNANNGKNPGTCDVGLFRGDTPLLAPYASVDNAGGMFDAVTSSVSYLDANNSLSARTYKVKVRGVCGINFSTDEQHFGGSSMTVLETQN